MPTKKQMRHRASIQRRRRQNWAKKCQFCGDRWHKAKWSCYHEPSKTCTGCLQYLNTVVKRGAAWMARRRWTLSFWDKRLESVVGGQTKLRAVAGGKR